MSELYVCSAITIPEYKKTTPVLPLGILKRSSDWKNTTSTSSWRSVRLFDAPLTFPTSIFVLKCVTGDTSLSQGNFVAFGTIKCLVTAIKSRAIKKSQHPAHDVSPVKSYGKRILLATAYSPGSAQQTYRGYIKGSGIFTVDSASFTMIAKLYGNAKASRSLFVQRRHRLKRIL